jgi:hypothetical protein
MKIDLQYSTEGPFLQAAILCRDVTWNDDGSYTLDGAANTIVVQRLKTRVRAKFFVSLAQGSSPMPSVLVMVEHPLGKMQQVAVIDTSAEPDIDGRPFTYMLELPLEIDAYGLHWVVVVTAQGGLLGRTPLHVTPAQAPGTHN